MSNKKFYGWWVTFGCLLVMMYTIGMCVNGFFIYFNEIAVSQGYTRTEISLTLTIASLFLIISSAFVGSLYKKYSTKKLMLIFGLMVTIGFTSFSVCNSLIHFYMCSILIGIGLGGGSFLPVSILINNWFNEKHELALSIAYIGTGLGGILFNLIASHYIFTSGYKLAFCVEGVLGIFLVIIAYLIIKEYPADIGQTSYGTEKNSTMDSGVMFSDAIKKPHLYGVIISILIVGIVNVGTISQFPTYLFELGYNSGYVTTLVMIMNGCLVVGKLLYGLINSKLGIMKGNVVSFCLWAIALIVLSLSGVFSFMPILFILIGMFGEPLATVALPLWLVKIFGKKDYARIFPIANIGLGIGTALGTVLTALLADITGSFIPAFILYVVLTIVSLVFIQMSIRSSGKDQLQI